MALKALNPRAMVVEDEAGIRSILRYSLEKEGFTVQVNETGDGVMDEISIFKPDVVILDRMLPVTSGIEICRKLRENDETSSIPIIIISARGDENDKLGGFEEGADDYIVKPFTPIELVARIKAIFRRMRPAFLTKKLKFVDIEMDLSRHQVFRSGGQVHLSSIEFQILQLLMENPNVIIDRQTILAKTRKPGSSNKIGIRAVDVHIARIRNALLKCSSTGEDVISTERNVGYVLRSVRAPSL